MFSNPGGVSNVSVPPDVSARWGRPCVGSRLIYGAFHVMSPRSIFLCTGFSLLFFRHVKHTHTDRTKVTTDTHTTWFLCGWFLPLSRLGVAFFFFSMFRAGDTRMLLAVFLVRWAPSWLLRPSILGYHIFPAWLPPDLGMRGTFAFVASALMLVSPTPTHTPTAARVASAP